MLTVGIYMYDAVEVLDFAGPFEVFSTASRIARRRAPDEGRPFAVTTVARAERPVRARGGLLVMPDSSFSTLAQKLDVLIVPGGEISAELDKPEVTAWISSVAGRATITASVCTGAFLLAKAGLLDGRKTTTHWEDRDALAGTFPALTVVPDVRWVDEGDIVTAAGISAGIDMSLHLVERLGGRELALATARQMEFDWPQD